MLHITLVGRRQAVRHRTLVPASGGSNPPAPAIIIGKLKNEYLRSAPVRAEGSTRRAGSLRIRFERRSDPPQADYIYSIYNLQYSIPARPV